MIIYVIKSNSLRKELKMARIKEQRLKILNCYWDLKTNKSKKIKTEEIKYIFIHMDRTIVEWNEPLQLCF